MILCIDIGNTNIRCALGTSENYRQALAETNKITDAEGFATFLRDNFGSDIGQIAGGIYASVVPHKNTDIIAAIRTLSKNITINPINTAKMCVDFTQYKNALGEDRAVCSWLAARKYGAPVVVIDFGTATTVNVVSIEPTQHSQLHQNKNSEAKPKQPSCTYIGGAILAGVQTGIDALARGTARLPKLDLSENGLAHINPIGQDTKECIISGAVIGTACAAEGYVQRIQALLAENPANSSACPKIIITGGNATKVIPHLNFSFIHEPNLLIEGLFTLYEITQ